MARKGTEGEPRGADRFFLSLDKVIQQLRVYPAGKGKSRSKSLEKVIEEKKAQGLNLKAVFISTSLANGLGVLYIPNNASWKDTPPVSTTSWKFLNFMDRRWPIRETVSCENRRGYGVLAGVVFAPRPMGR